MGACKKSYAFAILLATLPIQVQGGADGIFCTLFYDNDGCSGTWNKALCYNPTDCDDAGRKFKCDDDMKGVTATDYGMQCAGPTGSSTHFAANGTCIPSLSQRMFCATNTQQFLAR